MLKKKWLFPLLIVSGIVLAATFNPQVPTTTSSNPYTFPDISHLDITYTQDNPFAYRFYKITNINGTYYGNTGTVIDAALIHSLTESLTDLYEGYEHSYADVFTENRPHFIVVITFVNGKELTLESSSSYHCFIPWNVTYHDRNYVQYNGRIPSSLLPLLLNLDREGWSTYDKLARWGCYTPRTPENYTQKGMSPSFPQSEVTIPPEEALGKTHLLWRSDIAPVSSPFYSRGNVYAPLRDRVVCLNARTGEFLWELVFEREGEPLLSNEVNITGQNGTIYVGAPDSYVYCIAETGEVKWKYKTSAAHYFPLKLAGTHLLAFTGGVTCLTGQGEKQWEITDDTWNEVVQEEKILLDGRGEGELYHALVDIESGAFVWKEHLSEVSTPLYWKGFLLFVNVNERRLISLNVKTMKEAWSYYPQNLEYMKGIDDGILLLLTNKQKESLITLLDKNGKEKWAHNVPGEWGGVNVEVGETLIFLLREGGVIEAFDKENGDPLWDTEIKGSKITSFQIYRGRIYMSADDGNVYCLGTEGKVVWRVDTGNEFAPPYLTKEYVYTSLIGDDLLFAATKNGLYAFSL